MSKELLVNLFDGITESNFTWEIYLINVNRRKAKQPYIASKYRFRHDDAKNNYCKNLIETIKKYQIDPIESIQNYDGLNPKIYCDKLILSDDLIKDEYEKLKEAISISDIKLPLKTNAYIIMGQPNIEDNNLHPISLIKIANPIIKLCDNKKSIMLTKSSDDEWDILQEDVTKFYLNVDAVITNGALYSFNLRFEKFFNLTKTFEQNKKQVIDDLKNNSLFRNCSSFINYISGCSTRTFVTYNKERVGRLPEKRIKENVSTKLGIPIKENGEFDIENQNQASNMFKFLCDKLCVEIDTEECVNVNGIIRK